MKATKFIAILMFSFSVPLWSQSLKVSSEKTIDLSKEVVKYGRYAGTSIEEDEVEVLFYTGSENKAVNIFQYRFPKDLGSEASQALSLNNDEAGKYDWYITQEKIDKIASGNERFFKAKSNLMGALVIQFGNVEKQYENGIFTDWKFEKDTRLKASDNDIMKIMPAGFKSLSDYTRMNMAYGFSTELPKYGNEIMAPAGANMLAVGVIVDKISMKNPPKTNFNRIGALTIAGETLEDVEINEYLLPYAATAVTSGKTPGDHLGALFAPMKAPSTVKEHKQLNWTDRKNHFTFMRFNDDRSLMDSVSFLSQLMFANYSIMEAKDASLIVGVGDAKYDSWYRKAYTPTELKNIDGFQFTKIKEGQVVYHQLFTDKDLEAKMVSPEGEKVKFNFDPLFDIVELISLPNGDDLLLGYSLTGYFGFQLSTEGKLKAYYQLNRMDEKNSIIYDYQYFVKNNEVLLVWNEQKKELTNETQVEYSTVDLGNISSTSKTVKRLNEVYLMSKLVKINTAQAYMSNPILIGKDYYACGSTPALFTGDAVYFTGKDGTKGKELYLLKVDY